MSIAYRKEIDGLRALAVIPVVLFHAGFQEPSGGFIGVDVFFVISGFLITSIILSERGSGRFTLSGFYERRARRILPALFTVIIASLVFAYFFLLPDAFTHFGKSVASTSVFGSNVFFWSQDDYFAPEAKEIPLLHTWSLAVEEQFYLLFPLLILLFAPANRRSLIIFVAIVGLVSLSWAQWSSTHAPSANFYLLPSRAWELMVGALLAVALMHKDAPSYFGPLTRNALSLLGLVLVVGSIIVFDETTPFPSVYAVIPVIGTALLLAMATSDTIVGRILGSKPFVLVGLISYSIYLWHVPLLSFSEHILLDTTDLSLKLMLIAATFVLALVTWKFVETPFRQRQTIGRPAVLAFSVIASVALAAGGLMIAMNDGLPGRFDSYYLTFRKTKEQKQSWQFVERYLEAKKNESLIEPQDADEAASLKVAVLGNSHAKDLYNILHYSGLNVRLEPVITNKLCEEYSKGTTAFRECNRNFVHPMNHWDADRYIIAPRWNDKKIEMLPKLLSHLERFEKPIAVFGNTAEFHKVPECFAKHIIRSRDDSVSNLRRIERECIGTLKEEVVEPRNKRIRKVTERHGHTYIDRPTLICPEGHCTLLDDDLKHIYYDAGHLTLRGASYVAPRLLQNEQFMRFIAPPTAQGGANQRSAKSASEKETREDGQHQ